MNRLRPTGLFLLALGATLGTFLDWLHVVSRTTEYARPSLFGQPFWVPLLFGWAAVMLGLGRLVTGRLIRESPRPATLGEALFALGMFVVAYLESAYLPDSVALLALSGTALGLGLGLDRSLAGLVAMLLAALFGSLTEIAIIAAGGFVYVGADGPGFFFGIPHWLPVLYLCAAVCVGTFARWYGRG